MGLSFASNKFIKPKIFPNKINKIKFGITLLFLSFLFIYLKGMINRPVLADKHFAYAKSAMNSGDTENIIKELKLAFSLYPYEEYYYRFSVSEFSEHLSSEAAIEHVVSAIRINPANSSYYDSLGSLYLKQNRKQEAKRAYIKAYEVNPNCIEALINLGFLYHQEGNYKKAISVYKKGLDLAHHLGDVGVTLISNLIESLIKIGEIDEAIKIAEDVMNNVSVAPTSLPQDSLCVWDKIKYLTAKLYFTKKEYNKSCRLMEELTKKYPDNLQYFCDLGSAYYKAKEYAAARRTFQYVLSKDPTNQYANRVLSLL